MIKTNLFKRKVNERIETVGSQDNHRSCYTLFRLFHLSVIVAFLGDFLQRFRLDFESRKESFLTPNTLENMFFILNIEQWWELHRLPYMTSQTMSIYSRTLKDMVLKNANWQHHFWSILSSFCDANQSVIQWVNIQRA